MDGAFVNTVDLTTSHILLYPNPAVDILNLKLDDGSKKQYQILDYQGKLIRKGWLRSNSINIEGLAFGMYIVIMYDEEGNTWQGKFVKAK